VRKFARIQNGRVVEVFTHPTDISSMFHPSLVWVDVSSLHIDVAEGWSYDGTAFLPPTPLQPTPAPTMIDDLQKQLAALSMQVEAIGQSITSPVSAARAA